MNPGDGVGSYEILGRLGAGGMGEVYRARDPRLEREVAIKALPVALAQDADRLARLQREAQLLARLSHQHVAQVYGIEEHDGQFFVVMELAAGETLADRIGRQGKLPLNEAIPIAEQVCVGLAAAHEQGILHRDLKPANIMVEQGAAGRLQVKILDFGIAKTTAGDAVDLSSSPTVIDGTAEGVIQGTAPYMSPEQARGVAVDRRTDVWAFGCVLFEMLTGARAFDGGTVSDVIATILQREPDLDTLPADTPHGLRRLIQRCLAKEPAERLRDLHDVRLQLHDALAAGSETIAPPNAAPSRWGWGTPLALAGMVAAAAAGAWFASSNPADPDSAPVHLALPLPPGSMLTSRPAISADGETIAYAARSTPSGKPRIFVRRLDEPEARAVPGTDSAEYPALNADGSELLFHRNGVLWTAATAGGAPRELAVAPTGFGSDWISPTELLISPAIDGLARVSTTDGTITAATVVDHDAGEYAHTWPQVLPSRRQAVFRIWGTRNANGTALLDLATGDRRLLAPGRSGFVTGTGVLLAHDNTSNTLRGARLDLASDAPLATGVPVLDGFFWGVGDNLEWVAVSATGTLVYAHGDPGDRRLVWVDEAGNTETIDPARRVEIDAKLSFDGTKVLFREAAVLWLKDLRTGAEQTVVGSERGAVVNFAPLFSADDQRVVFASNRSGDWELYTQALDGSGGPELLLERPSYQSPLAVGPDGSVVFVEIGSETADDIWLLPPNGEPRPLVVTPAIETQARLTRDGTLLAYAGTGSGELEIYVVPVAGGATLRVSTNGGFDPAWSPDGQWLYYRSGDGVMRARILRQPELAVEPPSLFVRSDNISTDFGRSFDVGPDGRLLMIQPEPGAMPDRLSVVLNWFEELEALLPPR